MLLVLGKIGRGKFNERVYSNTENAILQSLAVEINKTTASLENTMEEINMILERELNFNKEENELLDVCNLVDKKECISLEEFLTTKIRYIIDASNEMLQIQNGILNSVVEGIDDINKTAKQMNEISDNIEKIDQYIDNIEKISLSTSILSLNASVEAASAGKYGNGFAVVATEVSLLSQKSKDIAKNMRAMTKKTLKQAEISKKVSIETKEKFSKIIEEIKKEDVLK
jgi:methyl-accepting chemotaxis protein